VEHPWRGVRAHFKLEWFAPTGSFKDRGASVMISILRQQGVTRLLEDSSGNGGAAIAAYAAAGGIKAKILVPAYTQPGKTVQIRAIRRGSRTDPGHASGHGRRGRAPSRADFLRQPQLAGPLPPGDEDAGLRALGRLRVLGARQRPHTHRRRQQRSRMRHRLRRTPAMRGDRAASSALRRPARELRSPLREFRLGR
jgi:Pyridoxal-phosphate dependent enzyme